MAIAIVDCRISEKCERALMLRGFTVIKVPPSSRLGAAVASHPDMLMFKCGDQIITSADYCDEAAYVFGDIREYCPSVRISFTDDVFEPEYPKDAIFNALECKGRLYCRTASISSAVKKCAEERGLKLTDVKQGYPACTVLHLSGEVCVTADEGMARALRECGVSVYVIENGDVTLPPYEYGFIGGAAGVYQGVVYFLGDLDTHRSKDVIKEACKAAKVTPVSLSCEPLADLGRIIFIDQKS
jgi:hypothetical protein